MQLSIGCICRLRAQAARTQCQSSQMPWAAPPCRSSQRRQRLTSSHTKQTISSVGPMLPLGVCLQTARQQVPAREHPSAMAHSLALSRCCSCMIAPQISRMGVYPSPLSSLPRHQQLLPRRRGLGRRSGHPGANQQVSRLPQSPQRARHLSKAAVASLIRGLLPRRCRPWGSRRQLLSTQNRLSWTLGRQGRLLTLR